MISILYLASALILGAAVTKRLGLKLLPFEAPALAVALGLLLWTWLSFMLALLLPYSLSLPLTVITAAVASFLLARHTPRLKWLPLPGKSRAWTAWGIFTLVTTTSIGWLMWTHNLIARPDGLYSANATWADFGLHASLISHFTAAQQLPYDLPIAAGTYLTYPFMVDLLSAWFVTGGWSLHLALFIPGVLLVSAFLQLMLGFGVRLFGAIGGAITGLTLTLLCGSAVGVFTAFNDFSSSGQSLITFLGQLPKDYTALTTPNAQLTNFLADAILPQRTFLMGLATFGAVLLLFTHLRQNPNTRLAVFTGVLIGLLPLVHPHTFIVLGALVVSFWVEQCLKTRRPLGSWLVTGAVALVVAAPQILWQALANGGGGTGGHLSLGWTLQPGESLLTFMANNYGLTLPLIITLAVILAVRRSLRPYLAWYAPIFVIFIIANIYSLQPFAYDNHKLLIYVYLFTYIFTAYGAIRLIRRHRLLIIPGLLIGVLLTASGALAVMREFQRQDQFASQDDIALASWAKQHTSPSDVFFATDRPNQPLATLGGRTLVAGYRGWLYNYNLEYQPRLDAIQSALRGEITADNIYRARYVAVSTYEAPEWTVSRVALATNYTLVYTNPTWTVYRLPAN